MYPNKRFFKSISCYRIPLYKNQTHSWYNQINCLLLEHCQDIRRFGSAATDLCYVACGRFEIYYEGYLQQWDIAAGILIVKNAGGVVKNFEGKEDYSENKIVACNPYLLKNALNGIFLN